MKVQIITIALAGSWMIGCLLSCYNISVKKQDAGTDNSLAPDISYGRQKAYLDSASEYMFFLEAAEKKISDNHHSIANLKEKLKLKPKEIRLKFQSQIDDFDEKNAALEINMKRYGGGDRAKWKIFKRDVNKEIDDLGKSIAFIITNLAKEN